MHRLFSEYGFSADLCLPTSRIRLFRDEADVRPDPVKVKEVLARAQRELEEPIPLCPASLYRRFTADGSYRSFPRGGRGAGAGVGNAHALAYPPDRRDLGGGVRDRNRANREIRDMLQNCKSPEKR